MLAAGADPDGIARELVRHTDSPILAIKALREVTGLSLPDAKRAVHRNLDPEVREAAEELWRELRAGLERRDL
ncbi:hypothetical protein L3i22_051800 [Actinoplanes sp. L3-i22]|nr:hypothetical protein L3i22_051800 [Actinoplanes sp. L3-i22]